MQHLDNVVALSSKWSKGFTVLYVEFLIVVFLFLRDGT